MESDEILRFLQEHTDWLSHATFWRNIGQMLLFGLLRLMYRIATFAEALIDSVLLARGFLENEAIGNIFNGMLIFSVSLTTLTLMIIAVRKLLNPKVDLKAPFVRGALIVALISSVPGLILRGLEVSVNTFEYTRVLGTEEHTSISMAVIRENVADMYFIANHSRGFDILHEATSSKNTLNEETIWHVDFTEVITPDDISSRGDLHALRYTTSIDSEGELGISRINNRWLDLFDEGYFRWTANWGVLYTTMPLITFFMFCTAFMLLTTLLDLIFLKIIIPILAPTDAETGQKMKHIAKDAMGSMLSIVLIGVSLSVFRILLGFIFELDLNFLARLIYLSAAITICMKGSSVFGKYLGVDIGMGNGVKSMLKLGAAGIAATKLGAGGVKLAKGIKNGIPKAASGAENGIKKLRDGAKNAACNTSESLGQMGSEFAGLGAKNFMKAKAMNAGESLKEGLSNVNPIPKVKNAFNENIGENFKEGLMKGDAKAVDGLTKLKDKEVADKRMDAIKANSKKAKKHDSNAPLPKFGESRKDSGSYNPNNESIDIFKGNDIPLSNGNSISNFNLESTGISNESQDTNSELTLPQFSLENSSNETNQSNSNPFDKVKGVSVLGDLNPSKSESKVAPKMQKSIQKASSKATVGAVNSLNAKKENPTPSTPKIKATSTKVSTSNVGVPSIPVTTAPRVTSTQPKASMPKITSSVPINKKKVEDRYEE